MTTSSSPTPRSPTTDGAGPGRRAPGGLAGLGLGKAVPLAAVAAAIGVALTHLVFGALGADFVVEPPGQAESEVAVAQAALVAFGVTLLGGGVAALLARSTERPARWFVVAVVVVLVLFAANPVLSAEQVLTVVALEVEHLVAAAAALALLLPGLRAREDASR